MADINIDLMPGTSNLLLTAGKWCNGDIVVNASLNDNFIPNKITTSNPDAFNFTIKPGNTMRLLTSDTYCDRNIMITVSDILPMGYNEIQYIQTKGSSYIISDITPNSNTKLKITFSTTSPGGCIIGCYQRWGPVDAYAIWAHAIAFGNEPLLNINLYKDGLTHTIEIIDGVYYLDGEEFFQYTGDYFEAPVPLNVFALNRNGSVYEINNAMYLYELEIDGTKFPLCTNEVGEIGIYNPHTQNFLTNSGTGNFIAGPKI